MRLTFLGTGAAFSPDAYNSCILVDETILLDAGAPLCVHLPRVGVGIDGPSSVLLTHFHADHTFGLASLILGRAMLHPDAPSLALFGPPTTEAYVRQLLDFAWGEDMRRLAWERVDLKVRELKDGEAFDLDGRRGRALAMTHSSRFTSLGYVLEHDGIRLGYTGDAELSPRLEDLVGACDYLVAEMTYDEPAEAHLSRKEIQQLVATHPHVRFILTHRGTGGAVSGAVLAHDFLTLELPLR